MAAGWPGSVAGQMRSNPGNGSAIEKVLAVLEALPEHERVTAIAQATGLPRSTVHRILQTLVEHEFAMVTGEGSYSGGPRILLLAGRVMSKFNPAQHAQNALRRLQEAAGHTVHFALLAGDEAVYAAKIEGDKPYRMPSRVGMSIRLHTTAIGKAILAAMPDEEVLTRVRRVGLERRTPNSITDGRALLRHLAQVRARGYALDEEENEAGIRCLGAAVFDQTGRVVGGVSVSVLALEVSTPLDGYAPAVLAAARDISASLGAPAAPAPPAAPAAAAPAGRSGRATAIDIG